MEPMYWSHREILQLIGEFRKEEHLWNIKSFDHGCRQARNESWKVLAANMKKPVQEVRRKVNSLWASYRRSRINDLKTGEYPKWRYYKNFSFINGREKRKEDNSQNLGNISDQSNEHYSNSENSQMDFDNFNECTESESFATKAIKIENDFDPPLRHERSEEIYPPAPQTFNAVSNQYDKRPRVEILPTFAAPANQGNSILPQAPPLTPIVHHTSLITDPLVSDPNPSNESASQTLRPLPKDECDAYGDYIACKLRCYPEKTKNMVQHYINNIIFEADMGKLC